MSILQKIDPAMADCQALVLAPTRELAQQIVKVVRALGDYMQLQVKQSFRLPWAQKLVDSLHPPVTHVGNAFAVDVLEDAG